MARKKSKAKIESKKTKTKNQVILTGFILLCPVLLLAMTGLVGDTVMKVSLFLYEGILLKNFIDDFYASRL